MMIYGTVKVSNPITYRITRPIKKKQSKQHKQEMYSEQKLLDAKDVFRSTLIFRDVEFPCTASAE